MPDSQERTETEDIKTPKKSLLYGRDSFFFVVLLINYEAQAL